MCGRLSLALAVPDLEERFGVPAHPDYAPRYNVAPGDDLDVLPAAEVDHMARFRWGLRPGWVDDPRDWSHPINARAETLAERPAFREAFAERRCLVVADGFYEWRGRRGSRRPYRVQRADGEPFAMAGLWERWGTDGDTLETVTVVTTEPNDAVSPIHDRMPAMLTPAEERVWLGADDPGALLALLDPYPAEETRVYEVSTAVNDPANDSPAVAAPLGHGQSGLGDFGG